MSETDDNIQLEIMDESSLEFEEAPAQPEENNLYDISENIDQPLEQPMSEVIEESPSVVEPEQPIDEVIEESPSVVEPEQPEQPIDEVIEESPSVVEPEQPEQPMGEVIEESPSVVEPKQPIDDVIEESPLTVELEQQQQEQPEEPEQPIIEVMEESPSEPAQPEENNLYDTPDSPVSVPSLIFIIPYRDREQHLAFFKNHMATVILKDMPENTYQFLIVKQNDSRSFNRGAMKNIGFLHVKSKYPNDYDKITLVFNDVDTMPYTNILNYETRQGIVKHFYGYTYALGGIFSINAKDFEETGGFPNFWAWGYEDNAMNQRVLAKNLTIDRSTFFPIMDKNILQLKDGITRLVNRGEYDDFKQNHMDTLWDIHNIQTDTEDGLLQVNAFETVVPKKTQDTVYDMTKSRFPFPSARRARMGMFF